MKFVIPSLIITMFFLPANSAISKSLFYQMSVAVFDDELAAFLEDVKPILRTGNESLGIPCLNPYEMDYYNITTVNDESSVEGDLTEVNIEGLPDYTVNHAKFRYAYLQIKLNLTWPNIKLNSKYRINAEITQWGYLPFYGKGDLKLEATNFTVMAIAKVGLKSGKIFVREMSTAFEVGETNFVASGIYDSKGVSQIANAIVSSQLPYLIENYHGVISSRIIPILKNLINRHLAELTFEDFINIIG